MIMDFIMFKYVHEARGFVSAFRKLSATQSIESDPVAGL
jgi:hypothetical protein